MGIQATLVQNILYSQMALVLFLLQPYLTYIRIWAIRKYNFVVQTTILKHIIIGMYVMILIMLLDSTYRWNKSESIVITYQNEKNFYLCAFTIFLALVLNKLCALLESTFKIEQFNKQTIKQSGNSRIFVNSLIDEHKSIQQKLENEIKSLREELSKLKNEELIENDENNKLVCSDDEDNKVNCSNDSNEWNEEPFESKFQIHNKADGKRGFTFLDNGR